MKYRIHLPFLLLFLIQSCQEKTEQTDQIINLPLTIVDGFGPFDFDCVPLTDQYSKSDPQREPWNRMYSPLTGIPKSWKRVVKSNIIFDIRQLIYQNYFAGNLSKDYYDSFQKEWKWIPDSSVLSKRPIKCEVYVIRGLDHTGKVLMMIDSDNDHDFGNETAFYPDVANTFQEMPKYKKTTILYEASKNGRTLTRQAPVAVKFARYLKEQDLYLYFVPQYAKAKLRYNGQEYEIAVRRGFSRTDYDTPEITLITKSLNAKRVGLGQGIRVGEVLTIGESPNQISYRFLGVDLLNDELLLRGSATEKQAYSLQVGYKFNPFLAQEFKTGKQINLRDYKGRYVYIDFWGTWCKPCVESLPELEKIYKITDRNKIEFIGIAMDSQKSFEKFFEKHPLPWPQILSDSINKLVETYGIEGYPFTLLIAPDGKVVERNLSGETLRRKLVELKVIKIEKKNKTISSNI